MSGKPAPSAAPRAGVSAPPPRLLLYVPDPHQLEPGAAAKDPPTLDALYLHDNLHHATRDTGYRTTLEASHHTGDIFYKSSRESDGKVEAFTLPDDTQHSDFFPVTQQYAKEHCLEVDNNKVSQVNNVNVKDNCANSINQEFNHIEAISGRILVESGESTNQARCLAGVDPDHTMSSLQPIVLHHGQNNFESGVVPSGIEGTSDRDLIVDKSYINYQFLEQSVSHQSIVNQSINLLNQQVGVSRGIVSDDSGNIANAPQFVRTADGVVLAVLPPPVLTHSTETPEVNSRTVQSDSPPAITVPLGWRRIINGSSVLYISPSGTALSTLPQLRDYLQTAGTCKCGLPCPLRPETTFSFDPKVVSKPYQPASGAELTKLCNHKRKLLATLQARVQTSVTPPPQQIEQKKVLGTEASSVKKKMKKRPGFSQNMSVSQMMIHRERPFNEFKTQDNDHNRITSPGISTQRINSQSSLPFSTVQPNVSNTVAQDNDVKQDNHVQRSSHYLTVNSGWITQQQENVDLQKSNLISTGIVNNTNAGLPVLGTNGQVIGVNTGFNKQSANFKNTIGVTPQNTDQDHKDERKDTLTQQNIQAVKQSTKEDESQIFCGLTPEVMQKINEQQQLFIQQNQKQIEIAMKGFRTQMAENQNKSQGQSQYMPQAQLVIQNGSVVKTNPAKTPPWQVKRNDSSSTNSMTSPSPKPQKLDNVDYEELNTNLSEESSSSNSSFQNNDLTMNQQMMCSRVPPLPQHYNIMGQQWPGVDMNKKKLKTNNKGAKKKGSPTENKMMTFNGIGMRVSQDPNKQGKSCTDSTNNVPSFMEDPSGYLAQQTVLLNNTISRQVGINTSYENSQFENSCICYSQNQIDKSCKPTNKPCEVSNIYRNNMVSNPSPSPNHTPDSSMVSDKTLENVVSQCCKGCNMSYKGNGDYPDNNQTRFKYTKQTVFKMELDGNSAMSSPKHGFDDNPVTSSTFSERSPIVNENYGPIQAGTVSTSNVSPIETLQPPEPSPTPSNSSRSTDTPHSSGSNNSQLHNNCMFPIPSPAYSNPGSCKDNINSNPSTPNSGQLYPYNSPGPPSSQSITGTQMMHFISNHNVNKNLMEVDNISMVGVKPGLKPQETFRVERRRIENSMPGYCPPPHLGGGPAHSLIQTCYVQTFVTTMASGFSVTRDTVTSVLAGKANTATTSINASQANFFRPPPPPSVNLATTYAIPNNQPDPFINSVNLPTSYPLHIAGTTAQNMISKSPLEMVQNVIGSLPSKSETSTTQSSSTVPQNNRRICQPTSIGQILISSTGQIIVSNNNMPPPPPKTTTVSSLQASSPVTNVTSSQVMSAVGGVQSIVNQPTVVVNTLPTPFVIQPSMMAVEGQVVQQNTGIPQIMAGGIENSRQIDVKTGQSFVQGVAMLSPESLKKRSKKKKSQATNITNVLQIAAPQQNLNNIMVHHSSSQQNTSPQFSPRSFQLSPNNNISPAPMLQALTIVPGKSGTPAHIVMNGQGSTNNFGSQQIITNTSPSQQINLLQPVNLINNASNVMQNFPAFQQIIVPNLSGMVMTADGTAIIQDNSTGVPMQLQLQTVNNQNVLTPVQSSGVFATGSNGGVVIRAQNQQGKIIQSQHSPGAQFLSPGNQVMMSSPNFNGQLSPLLANLSPSNVAFNTSPHQVRSSNVQAQEFIQTNQMGQTVMVPLSPKQGNVASATNNRTNSTFVQQNTTIVQQQTTLLSNSHNTQVPASNSTRLSIDPHLLIGANNKQGAVQSKRNFVDMQAENNQEAKSDKQSGAYIQMNQSGGEMKLDNVDEYGKFLSGNVRCSVSTQTRLNQQRARAACVPAATSPPDTTTHSPLGAMEARASPSPRPPRPPRPPRAPADTTTDSPEPADANSSAMVQCVSSSEQDMAESREHTWPVPRNDFTSDTELQNMISNVPIMRQNRSQNAVESTELHYNQSMNTPMNQQNLMQMTPSYYDRTHSYKRKNDFGDGSSYRTDKMMRTNYGMVHAIPKPPDYDMEITSPEKSRHFSPSGTSSDTSSMQNVFDRHNLGSGNDVKEDESDVKHQEVIGEKPRKFGVGDLVWGPVKGYASWPGKLQGRREDGRWHVRWFGGDKATSPVEDSKLLTLTEGLEAHHAARTKHRKSRKLNTLLENAIQEAMAELDKISENVEVQAEGTSDDSNVTATIVEMPKRSKKEKSKSKDKHIKKTPVKLTPNSKLGEGSKLRSLR